MNTSLRKRKNSLRKSGYDYSAGGAYFITICAHKKLHFFGEIEAEVMRLSPLGLLAERYWLEIPEHYSRVELDKFVIMPNHMHGILVLHDATYHNLLGHIIGQYKAAVTRRSRQIDVGVDLESLIWQRNYHDRIIRNQREYEYIAQYVELNPALWEQDKFFG